MDQGKENLIPPVSPKTEKPTGVHRRGLLTRAFYNTFGYVVLGSMPVGGVLGYLASPARLLLRSLPKDSSKTAEEKSPTPALVASPSPVELTKEATATGAPTRVYIPPNTPTPTLESGGVLLNQTPKSVVFTSPENSLLGTPISENIDDSRVTSGLLRSTATAIAVNHETSSFVESDDFTKKMFEQVRRGTYRIDISGFKKGLSVYERSGNRMAC